MNKFKYRIEKVSLLFHTPRAYLLTIQLNKHRPLCLMFETLSKKEQTSLIMNIKAQMIMDGFNKSFTEAYKHQIPTNIQQEIIIEIKKALKGEI